MNEICYNKIIRYKGGKCDERKDDKMAVVDGDFFDDTYSVWQYARLG